jgi:hypothetical protein
MRVYDRTEVLCAVSRLVVVRPVEAAPVGCVYSRPGASPQCITKRWITAGYSMWRSLGQAQAGAPAVPSTVGSTDVSLIQETTSGEELGNALIKKAQSQETQ